MKKVFLLGTVLFSSMLSMAQVEFKNGPELENDRHNQFNRMLGGDENSFYCYRVRSRGRGTSYFIEKYNRTSLKLEFSRELDIKLKELDKIEDVQYAGGKIYIFIRSYDKIAYKMSLYFQSMSPAGIVITNKEELVSVSSGNNEFVGFGILQNPGKTKFLISVVQKKSMKENYKTDFILLGANNMQRIWEKRMDTKVRADSNSYHGVWGGWVSGHFDDAFIGLHLDDDDNIYYAVSEYNDSISERDKPYRTIISILEAKSEHPNTTELSFGVYDMINNVRFSITPKKELLLGGFISDRYRRRGDTLANVGMFSITMDISNGEILSRVVKRFDNDLLTALESDGIESRKFKYKLDHVFLLGNDVFYVGEQYAEKVVSVKNTIHMAAKDTIITTTTYFYEYRNVIVAKLDSGSKFEWIKRIPLRINRTLNNYPHVFKQYIAVPTGNAIYILNNEHEGNLEIYKKPDFKVKDMRSISEMPGSNFVYTSVSLDSGSTAHGLIFHNKEYYFDPVHERNPNFVPPAYTEIFVMDRPNELFVYTKNKDLDRFTKLILK